MSAFSSLVISMRSAGLPRLYTLPYFGCCSTSGWPGARLGSQNVGFDSSRSVCPPSSTPGFSVFGMIRNFLSDWRRAAS